MADDDHMPDSFDSEAPLFTTRLVLEPIRTKHAAPLFTPLQDAQLYTFIPDDPPVSLDVLEGRYRRWQRRAAPDGPEVWLNWAAQAQVTGEWVGIFQATLMEDGAALLAYMIFAPFQRRGFAREGCARIIEYLASAYSVKVVAAEIDTRNTSSIALVSSLGFRLVATIYGADRFKGTVSNEYRFELAIEQE